MSAPSSNFYPLNFDLLEKVRGWRNLPRIRNNMLTNSIISSEQQIKWFESLVADKSRLYFVFFQDANPIGMLYFVDITKEDCSWGCYIGEDAVWPGSGLLLEVAALDFALKKLSLEQLNAEVFDFNSAPQKMHKIFGYTSVDATENTIEREGKEHVLFKFQYKKTDWINNREKIVAKLPKQIREGIENIRFINK